MYSLCVCTNTYISISFDSRDRSWRVSPCRLCRRRISHSTASRRSHRSAGTAGSSSLFLKGGRRKESLCLSQARKNCKAHSLSLHSLGVTPSSVLTHTDHGEVSSAATCQLPDGPEPRKDAVVQFSTNLSAKIPQIEQYIPISKSFACIDFYSRYS